MPELITHVHQWHDSEIYCEDCGTHPAAVCDCGAAVDLIFFPDPRDDGDA